MWWGLGTAPVRDACVRAYYGPEPKVGSTLLTLIAITRPGTRQEAEALKDRAFYSSMAVGRAGYSREAAEDEIRDGYARLCDRPPRVRGRLSWFPICATHLDDQQLIIELAEDARARTPKAEDRCALVRLIVTAHRVGGSPQEAVDAYMEMMEEDPGSSSVWAVDAVRRAYEALGQVDAGIEELRELAAEYPGTKVADDIREGLLRTAYVSCLERAPWMQSGVGPRAPVVCVDEEVKRKLEAGGLGHYEVDARLGEGDHAAVWEVVLSAAERLRDGETAMVVVKEETLAGLMDDVFGDVEEEASGPEPEALRVLFEGTELVRVETGFAVPPRMVVLASELGIGTGPASD